MTALHAYHAIFRVYEIPMSQPFASTRFFMAFTPRSARRLKGKDKLPWLTWTKAQRGAKGLFWPLALWRQSRSFCWLLSESLAKTWDRTHRKRRSSRHTCDKENQQCRMTWSNLRSTDSASNCPSVCHL